MNNLQDLIDEAKLSRCDGVDYEYRKGFVEALNFAIRKHKEQWNIEDFKKDLIETEIN